MKKTLLVCLLFVVTFAQAQTFTPKANFPGGTRQKLTSVALGTKVFFATN